MLYFKFYGPVSIAPDPPGIGFNFDITFKISLILTSVRDIKTCNLFNFEVHVYLLLINLIY